MDAEIKIDNSKGFLYTAVGVKYLKEAEIAATSLRRFTSLPICMITDDNTYTHPVFDQLIFVEPVETYANKILALSQTPFDKTIFLDSDTFVCAPIDNLFDALDIFDMAMTVDNFMHSYAFFLKHRPDFKLRYETVIPEYNTGVIAMTKNPATTKLLADWMRLHEEMNVKADMASFREAFIDNAHSVRIVPLPFEYNYHGTNSFGFLYNEVKVIHERLGEKWGTLTTMMLGFEKMDRLATKLNKYTIKRIVVPYFGVIPYTWSPYSIKKKIKRWFGVKHTKKAETFTN